MSATSSPGLIIPGCERFLEHRIADKRVLRLIRKWLTAGVIEDGNWFETAEGSPQGASVSPLLANVYLHYVFDLWADWWRRRYAHGDVIIVRFADDFVVGFQHLGDAKRFLSDLRKRFAKFSLELHPDKTRLIEFGRFAAKNRRGRGLAKPETFDFLGFTHVCGKTRDGRFWLRRITIKKRMRAKLKSGGGDRWSPGIFVDISIMLLLVPDCQIGARNPLGLSCRADVVSGRDCNIARCSRTRRS